MEYFSKVGENLADQIKDNTYNFNVGGCNRDSLFLAPITRDELLKEINSLKINSAGGDDNISAKLLKLITCL